MSVSLRNRQCTLFFRLDEEGYADTSSAAMQEAEWSAQQRNAYPVAYPEPFNSVGCGYGSLCGYVTRVCDTLASRLGLDVEHCIQTDPIITLYAGTQADYETFLAALASQLQPVRPWVLNADELVLPAAPVTPRRPTG